MLQWPWLTYLRDLNLVSILVRIALSMLIGGVLGAERGRKNRPAGFRTYMLVCLGSAMVMMTNQYVSVIYGGSDLVRMGAQVVSGIGFLGAGTIIVTGRNQVKGITTAAGLWTAACSGLAIGIGFYEGAVLGGLAIFMIMALMQQIDDYIHKNASYIALYLELEGKFAFSDFLGYAGENLFEISEVQVTKNKFAKEQVFCVVLTAKSRRRRTHSQMLEVLSDAPGIHYIEELS